jgi:hypothetical protein
VGSASRGNEVTRSGRLSPVISQCAHGGNPSLSRASPPLPIPCPASSHPPHSPPPESAASTSLLAVPGRSSAVPPFPSPAPPPLSCPHLPAWPFAPDRSAGAMPHSSRRRLDAGAVAGREDAAAGRGGGLQRTLSDEMPTRGSGDGRQRRDPEPPPSHLSPSTYPASEVEEQRGATLLLAGGGAATSGSLGGFGYGGAGGRPTSGSRAPSAMPLLVVVRCLLHEIQESGEWP